VTISPAETSEITWRKNGITFQAVRSKHLSIATRSHVF